MLALLGLRGRSGLLLGASIAALLLALVPFSLHSFVLGPTGILYAVAYVRLFAGDERGVATVLVNVACPLLLLAALVVLVVHEDPACYRRTASGTVIVDHGPGPTNSGSGTAGPGTRVVERGCTSDTVVWWEAMASLGLTLSAIVVGTGPTARRGSHQPA